MDNIFICPACKSGDLSAKYEAKYIYSYKMDSNAPGLKNTEEFLPFMYDNREQQVARQYIECNSCGTQYPCFFTDGNKGVDFSMLQKAINLDNAQRPYNNK